MRRSLLALMVCALVAPAPVMSQTSAGLSIEAISTRPNMVTGGDVLIQIRGDVEVAESIRVQLNDLDVTDAFEFAGAGLLGLVDGLVLGANEIDAELTLPDGTTETANLTLDNYPIEGPVFSGPHQRPFICETASAGLGEPDENCHVPSKVEYFYKSSVTTQFRGFDPSAGYPPDLASTTTSDGNDVPFIVRVESGAINRGIYRIGMLDDPAARGSEEPFTPGLGWNGKLGYFYGGGCNTGYHQGTNQPGVLGFSGADQFTHQVFLRRGYAIATSSLNVLGLHCNDVVSAETTMMVKEHFIERYGIPGNTVGVGGSGGAIQQHQIATAYPGLLDAIIPVTGFPDVPTTAQDVYDCVLLNGAFLADPVTWNEAKRSAVHGFRGSDICLGWADEIGPTIRAGDGCAEVVPPELIYDPVGNPTGARCTIQDSSRNIYGLDPTTGFARRWYDNEGLQYGLRALNEGAISPDEFIELNTTIGGFDIDGNPIANRTRGDLEAIETAYRTGRVVSGGGGLPSIPIIDLGVYADHTPHAVGAHDRFRALSLRARMVKNGRWQNHVIWSYSLAGLADTELAGGIAAALTVLDEWLGTIAADPSDDPLPVKVVRAKPANAVDKCVPIPGVEIIEPASVTRGTCATIHKPHASPRIVAGESIARDTLKCTLKPIDWGDYRVTFTSEQRAQLEALFPSGVCDWSAPSQRYHPIEGTWISFGPA